VGVMSLGRPGCFSAYSRAAIELSHIGPCFGSVGVAAQALKGRRARMTLSTIKGPCFVGLCLVLPIVPGPFGILYV
jgi:hypothetical protein